MPHPLFRRLAGPLALAAGPLALAAGLLAAAAHAQNPALDLARDQNADLQPSLRENLATIGRYAKAVNRQVERLGGGTRGEAEATRRPEAPARRLDALLDPFEVSPQLRDGRRPSGSFAGLPATGKLDLQRQIQVKALLITPQGKGAQLSIRRQETITVVDRQLLDLGDLGVFQVHIDRDDGVVLSTPGLPQGSKVFLR